LFASPQFAGRSFLYRSHIMFPQLIQLARVQTPLLLVLFDLHLATLTGASTSTILRREQRRRQRRAVARLSNGVSASPSTGHPILP
jgi:hypothetical protein